MKFGDRLRCVHQGSEWQFLQECEIIAEIQNRHGHVFHLQYPDGEEIMDVEWVKTNYEVAE